MRIVESTYIKYIFCQYKNEIVKSNFEDDQLQSCISNWILALRTSGKKWNARRVKNEDDLQSAI
jgi:hypothetical protein